MKNEMFRPRGGLLAASVAAAMCMLTTGATAAPIGPYAAIDVGPASLGVKNSASTAAAEALLAEADDPALTVVDLDSSLDKSDIGLGVTWGYRFSPYLATEVSLLHMGKAKWRAEGTVNDGVGDLDGQIRVTQRSSGASAAALGSWPLGERFSVDARAGLYFVKTKQRVSYQFDTEFGLGNTSDSKTGLLVGAGGTWNFSRAAALRLSYTLYPKAIDGEDIGRIALGFQYSLGQ